jgi:hypothetical protein
MNQATQQPTGFSLARHIASWLPAADEAVALRIIARAEREQAEAERLDLFAGVQREDWSAG